MLRKLLVPFVLVLLPGLIHANKLKIIFSQSGEQVVWHAPALGSKPAEDATTTSASELEMDLAPLADRENIYVWNKTSNNIASQPVGLLKENKDWKVLPSDEHAVGDVIVRAEHEGKAMASGTVIVTIAGKNFKMLLSPSQNGEAKFFGLPTGPMKVVLEYVTAGVTKSAPAQTWDLSAKRDQGKPKFTVVISEKVDVVTPATPVATIKPGAGSESEATGPQPAGKDKDAPARPILGTILSFALGLGLAVALGYFVLQTLKKNQPMVHQQLSKLGVPIPTDPNADPSDGVVAMPPTPEPMKPIILYGAVTDPVVAMAAVNVVANPRLVNTMGDVILISDSGVVIGRETNVPDPSVSRSHAQLSRAGDSVMVKDLGSTNKTFVNGVAIGGTDKMLQPGDSVQFGTVKYRFEV